MTTYEQLTEDMQGRPHVKVANNTYAHRIGPDLITITLHGHTILTFSSAGSIGATDAGWPTTTTVRRLNAFTPERFLFTSSAGEVFVIDREDDDVHRIRLRLVECLLPDADKGAGVVLNLRGTL